MQSIRKTALDVLMRIEKDESFSNLALDSALRKNGIQGKDAAFVTTLTYGVMENRITLDYFISVFSKRSSSKIQPALLNILRLGAYQLLFLDRVPDSAAVNECVLLSKASGLSYASGFVNGVLREIARNKQRLPYPDEQKDRVRFLEVKYSCPKWLIRKWDAEYGREDTQGILESLRSKLPVTARVNTCRISSDALIRELAEEGIEARKEPLIQPEKNTLSPALKVDEGCLTFDRLHELKNLEAFRKGLFIIQGRASQICCRAVDPKPGESVLDLCAAPGGKSFHMAFRMQNRGRILSCELYDNRLSLIREGASRLGITILEAKQNDASRPNPEIGEFDRVLCDVPCSGLGVIGKKPEIRYKEPDALGGFPELQYSILSEGSRHVKSGGTLVYSTCTLSRAENDSIAQRFLEENPDFRPGNLPECMNALQPVNAHTVTLMPHKNACDGFFIALFQRREDA